MCITENSPIPLAFENLDGIILLSLCKEYHKKWKVEYFYNKWIQKHEPNVENHYLAFRRMKNENLPTDSVLMEVVRCNEKYALFASDKKSGYVLTLAKKSAKDTESDTFYIYTSFEYVERSEMESMEQLSSEKSTASENVATSSHMDKNNQQTSLPRRHEMKKDRK